LVGVLRRSAQAGQGLRLMSWKARGPGRRMMRALERALRMMKVLAGLRRWWTTGALMVPLVAAELLPAVQKAALKELAAGL
jgi:hypothetical protein